MLQVYAQVGVYPVAHGHSYPGGRVDHLTAAGDHQQRMIVENLDPLAPQVSVVLQRPEQGGVLVAIAVDLFNHHVGTQLSRKRAEIVVPELASHTHAGGDSMVEVFEPIFEIFEVTRAIPLFRDKAFVPVIEIKLVLGSFPCGLLFAEEQRQEMLGTITSERRFSERIVRIGVRVAR